MRFPHSPALLLSLLTTVWADGCHKNDDSIGKYCRYFTEETFNAASGNWCSQSNGHLVIEGQSYNFKTPKNDDGAGGTQIFWGNYRVDRDGDHTITTDECNGYMSDILAACGGYGGWVNTGFGTVFGECIRE